MMIITIVSILILTFIAWVARQITRLKICPFCAGVAGTWIWMLAAHYAGYSTDVTIISMLMGGSVVGISYLLDVYSAHSLLRRTIFIIAGFGAVYALINYLWIWFFVSAATAGISAISISGKVRTSAKNEGRAAELEAKMKNCC